VARTLKYVSAMIALTVSTCVAWAQDGIEISDIDQDGVADVAANVPPNRSHSLLCGGVESAPRTNAILTP